VLLSEKGAVHLDRILGRAEELADGTTEARQMGKGGKVGRWGGGEVGR
jgi:hypothetical protein